MSFNLPYKFQTSGRIVVVQHSHGGYIRVSPNNTSYPDGSGATGGFAQWKIHLCGGPYIRLQSCKTGNYLRIYRSGREIDVNGGTGPFTKFKYHIHSRPNGIKLESDRFPGRYIAVNPNRSMKIGSGGHHCNLWIKRDRGGQPQVIHKVVQQPQTIIYKQPSGQVVFNNPYIFRQNNTIVIRSNYGKHLRVSPNNTYGCDGNGGTGKYARWRIMLEGGGVIKLQNTHTGKYLRIEKSNAVNCGGTGGQLTRFRYHVHRSPHGVKLESCRFPGKYVAIRPNGVVMHGTGGVHTKLTFLREGGQVQTKVIYTQQPKVTVIQQPVQPQVVIQQPQQPQVIVQQPSPNYQQQLAQQQLAQQQQQQQLAQQQMEQIKLQNEASLKSQQQQLELERQKMQQDMELQRQQLQQQQQQILDAQNAMLQQQQAQFSNASNPSMQSIPSPTQNEGVISGNPPYNPYYGNTVEAQQVVNNNNIVPSYPVLNKPIEQEIQQQQPPIEEKEPDIISPIGGQYAANEVLQWLTQLKMERYYKTFIENGYDQLESIGDITKEDLKEMGVALGHIKIIVASSITAPFQNKKCKIKSVRYDTYLHEYGKPKQMNDGVRCILQHNEKKDLPGCIWKFELLEDNFFRLKHVPTGSWLRLIKPDGEVDTRSPFDQWSKLSLEKDEKSKGVYYIKEIKQDNYVRFDEARSFGYNKVEGTLKRDNNCKINLLLIKEF